MTKALIISETLFNVAEKWLDSFKEYEACYVDDNKLQVMVPEEDIKDLCHSIQSVCVYCKAPSSLYTVRDLLRKL